MLARCDDLLTGTALVFDGERRVLRADTLAEVPGVLAGVEQASRDGWWSVGYLAHEAAPALDPDLVTAAPDPSLPLAWFAVGGPPRRVPALQGLGRGGWSAGSWRLDWDAATHAERVAAVREAIAAGTTYQANLCTTARSTVHGDLTAFYADLARAQRGAHHTWLDLGDHVVASASPERFFEWRGEQITCRPMKGTAARRPGLADDLVARDALLASPKERAENLMIVDMVRNDLSRLAVPGTVEVTDLFRAERYPSVWQLVSDVTAGVPAGTTLTEVLRALFPCASITGAPRHATTALLTRLEDGPRGIYTGALGWLAPEGAEVRASFAVAIRTVVVERASGAARYGVGSGITWSSEPAAEHAELQTKTRVLAGPGAVPGPGGEPVPARRPGPGGEFGLVETFARRERDGNSTNVHLDDHLARLAASAAQLGFTLDVETLRTRLLSRHGPARVRLELARDGAVEITESPLPDPPGRVLRLALDPEPVDSGSPWLRHKTTYRRHYDERTARHSGVDDVLLVNEHGHVTESCTANLAVRLDGRWWTPPLADGLLPGVGRARLLAAGELAERSVSPLDLARAEGLALVSSLRGWRQARLTVPPGPVGPTAQSSGVAEGWGSPRSSR